MLIVGFLLFLGMPVLAQLEQQTLRDQFDLLKERLVSESSATEVDSLLSLARENEDPELVFDILNWLGDYLTNVGDYERSMKLCIEATDIARQTGDARRIAHGEMNIGTLQFRTGNYERSIATYRPLVDAFMELGDTLMAGKVRANMALNYRAEGKLDTAVQQLLLARAMIGPQGSPRDLLSINQNLGAIYAQMGMPERGLPYFRQILATVLEERDTFGFAPAYGNLAYTFQQLGDFDRALTYYDNSLYYSRLLKQDAITYVTLLDISDGYEANRDDENALKYFKEHQRVKESVLGENTLKRVAELEVVHETEQQKLALEASEQKVVSLEQEAMIRKQRLSLVFTGFIFILLVAFFVFRQGRKDIHHRETKEKLIAAELENERMASRLLNTRLENQQEDLTNFALDIERKNNFSRNLADRMDELRKLLPAQLRPKLDELIHFVQGHEQLNKNLEVVQENVDQVNHEFHQKLIEAFPNLTSSDRALAGLLRLNMTNKEVAMNRGISTASAKMARYRLRKKLNLASSDDIIAFLREI